MYSWISFSSADAAPNLETKRKIRSHVTKSVALQRRKDDERQPYDPHCVAPDSDSAWRRHRNRKRASFAIASKPRVAAAQNPSRTFPLRDSNRGGEWGDGVRHQEESSADEKSTIEYSATENLTGIGGLETATSRSHRKYVNTKESTPEPSVFSIWSVEMPRHGDVMLRVCALQINRFRPEISIEAASEITGGVWGASPCSVLSYALCLASLGHVHANSSGESGGVIPVFKGKVFCEIIKRLPAMDTVMSDEIVPSLLCLTSFELSRASLESRTHLQALKTIWEIKQRDIGVDFPIMLEALDILHSIMFNLPTITALESIVYPGLGDVDNLMTYLLVEQSDPVGIDLFASRMHLQVNVLLSELRTLMSDTLDGFPLGQGGKRFFDKLEEFRLRYCAGVQSCSADQYTARKCYHLFAILYNVLVNRRQFRHSSNAKHATSLYFAIRDDSDGAWDRFPRLKMWILAVALSTSRDAGEQSLFQDRLATAIYHLGPDAWSQVRSFLCSFLRTRNRLNLFANPPTRPQKKRSKTQTSLPTPTTSPDSTDKDSKGSSLPQSTSTASSSNVSRIFPATTNTNPKIYPGVNTYPFMSTSDFYLTEEEHIMTAGYGYLAQHEKFGNLLQRGDSGRISFIGCFSPESGWTALF